MDKSLTLRPVFYKEWVNGEYVEKEGHFLHFGIETESRNANGMGVYVPITYSVAFILREDGTVVKIEDMSLLRFKLAGLTKPMIWKMPEGDYRDNMKVGGDVIRRCKTCKYVSLDPEVDEPCASCIGYGEWEVDPKLTRPNTNTPIDQ